MITVKIEERPECYKLPEYQTEGSAGMDLYAAGGAIIHPGGWALISCGFRIALPIGFEAQIRPRSGIALKYGVTVLNSPGTIDSDYRGDIGVVLVNHGFAPYKIDRGDRIAQMVIAAHGKVKFAKVLMLATDTVRGEGGYGSTGK